MPAALAFTLTSPDFKDGGTIPDRFTCKGENVPPTLVWSGAPVGTESFMLSMEDPDAPRGTWIHWVVYNISGNATGIDKHNNPGILGLNTSGVARYMGPCPPSGIHHYHLTIYALDAMLKVQSPATLEQVTQAMSDHILGAAKLTGLYPPSASTEP